MAYVTPQVLVFQDFELQPSIVARPLRACMIGGHAQLVRFDQSTEREFGLLDYYDYTSERCFSWPNRTAGGVIDQAYTEVWVKNALLQYFTDVIGAGSEIVKVSGYTNRVRSDTVNFVENDSDYPRDAALLDRDVKVGDVAKVRAVVDDEVFTLWTSVMGFVGDVVAAVVASAAADSNNAASQSADSTVTKTGGADNCISLTAGGSYSGLASGYLTETYTITVTESSAGSQLTTARLRVRSASGTDDADDVAPADAASPTAIGSRGLEVTFDFAVGSLCSADSAEDEVSADDLIAGQEWTVEVSQVFTAPVGTSGGTYSGNTSTSYIVEVTRGGLFADTLKPQISCTTAHGTDLSGPTDVTAASTAITVGTQGVTISFGGTYLRKGDKYVIEVEAEGEGRVGTLILAHDLDSEIPADTEVDLTLYIRVPELQIEANRTGAAPLTNWEQSATEICLQAGITAYESSWTDDGVAQALPLRSEESQEYGQVYVTYRAWLPTLANEVNATSTISGMEDLISGVTHPDNPLRQAVSLGLGNSNGVDVRFIAVADPSLLSSWEDALEKLDGRRDVYNLVPLTADREILTAIQTHINSMSAPDQALFRSGWFGMEGVPTKQIVDAEINGDTEVLAILADDPFTSGTQYTRLSVPEGDAEFVTREVAPGDIVRYLWVSDGFGNFTYTEFTVDAVLSEDSLRLLTGHSVPISTPQKIEIVRNLSATAEADEIGLLAGAWASRRIRSVWPDTIENGDTEYDSMFLCAALAGLCSGIVPQQPMTRLEIAGFSAVPRTVDKFNKTQLDAMAAMGVWIVTQDPDSGAIYTRHAVTTADTDDINKREEVVTRNVDSISFRFHDTFEPYIGISNVTPNTESIIRSETNRLLEELKSEGVATHIGPQLLAVSPDGIESGIRDLRQHPTLRDRFVLAVNLVLPYPFNNLENHLIVV